jgi:hypothetical protein
MRLTGVVIILICATGVWGQAQTENEAATKSKIVALEQLWNQAYKSGDVKALNSILDDAIVVVNDDGSVQTKAEFLASIKSSAPQPGRSAAAGRSRVIQRAWVRKCGHRDRRHAGQGR